MSQPTKSHQEARDSGHTVSWLVLSPQKDGSYQNHEASVSATGLHAAANMFEAIQSQWRVFKPSSTRVRHHMMLQKVAVDIVDLLDTTHEDDLPTSGTQIFSASFAGPPIQDSVLTRAFAHPHRLETTDSGDFFMRYEGLSVPGPGKLPRRALVLRWETNKSLVAGVQIALMVVSTAIKLAVDSSS